MLLLDERCVWHLMMRYEQGHWLFLGKIQILPDLVQVYALILAVFVFFVPVLQAHFEVAVH